MITFDKGGFSKYVYVNLGMEPIGVFKQKEGEYCFHPDCSEVSVNQEQFQQILDKLKDLNSESQTP